MKAMNPFFAGLSTSVALLAATSVFANEDLVTAVVATTCPSVHREDPLLGTRYSVEIAFVSRMPICFPSTATAEIDVYAYDEFVADVPATLIKKWAGVDVSGSGIVRRGFEAEDLRDVRYQSGGSGALNYYFHYSIDLNGDGEVCNGDLVQNHEKTPFTVYAASQTTVVQEVELRAVYNRPCGQLSGGGFCQNPDFGGWVPESCLFPPVTTDLNSPECVDEDGDGWGWNGSVSCETRGDDQVIGRDENLITGLFCADPDGDGWGWDGNRTCRADAVQQTESTVTSKKCVDSNGDGWGWDGEQTCKVDGVGTEQTESPGANDQCIDSDGDGWGWNGIASCRP